MSVQMDPSLNWIAYHLEYPDRKLPVVGWNNSFVGDHDGFSSHLHPVVLEVGRVLSMRGRRGFTLRLMIASKEEWLKAVQVNSAKGGV